MIDDCRTLSPPLGSRYRHFITSIGERRELGILHVPQHPVLIGLLAPKGIISTVRARLEGQGYDRTSFNYRAGQYAVCQSQTTPCAARCGVPCKTLITPLVTATASKRTVDTRFPRNVNVSVNVEHHAWLAPLMDVIRGGTWRMAHGDYTIPMAVHYGRKLKKSARELFTQLSRIPDGSTLRGFPNTLPDTALPKSEPDEGIRRTGGPAGDDASAAAGVLPLLVALRPSRPARSCPRSSSSASFFTRNMRSCLPLWCF